MYLFPGRAPGIYCFVVLFIKKIFLNPQYLKEQYSVHPFLSLSLTNSEHLATPFPMQTLWQLTLEHFSIVSRTNQKDMPFPNHILGTVHSSPWPIINSPLNLPQLYLVSPLLFDTESSQVSYLAFGWWAPSVFLPPSVQCHWTLRGAQSCVLACIPHEWPCFLLVRHIRGPWCPSPRYWWWIDTSEIP